MKLALIIIQEVLLFAALVWMVATKDVHGTLLILIYISIIDIRRKLE